jgi:hypothetical protein
VIFGFLPEAFLLAARFGADFFSADFLGRFTGFVGDVFLREVLNLVDFFLVFFLPAIRAV